MTPQELREQQLRQPMSILPAFPDDIPTVTVQASFDWKFWLLAAGAAWVLWESIGYMTQGEHRRR